MTIESEEEATYLTMPEQLQDKMKPLDFMPFCMKDEDENLKVIMTPELLEMANQQRRDGIAAEMRRVEDLQEYNELYMLGRQKTRCQLIETLFVDSQWSAEHAAASQALEEAIALEILTRNLSATKKKQDSKKK
ncbi:hypothetical protein ACJJTC_015254 [Scirpophaga incertulas]